ncbi:MAG: hypothetical protein AOA65_1274 [Candidatus Bathyarchaeota archaeon BA1]|nr:MAG: hypothetical protein AOA65_1274 [Candidatus Bathyarchaeota archaeon BA1]
MAEEELLLIEKALTVGGGKWIADFTESFRNFKVKNQVFDLFVKGHTRAKGFFLSRIASYFVCPDYRVGCFIFRSKKEGYVNRTLLSEMLDAIRGYMRKNELKWTWLMLLQRGWPNPFKRFVEDMTSHDVGIILYDTNSGELSYNSPLGKQMAKRAFPKALLKRGRSK